ncbi:hypothetical protein HOP61_00780 [Halomonas daqingensis]|uniref:Uncharacterized protein n=1 Tax=Billgrantia desiderata TaxID=52021 RepID=A0AAW4YMX3_9GAMM|nr:hypothetical protein [Halomonas desiderata]MCE8049829.1 hypothetical protein [Halomonas desiderata]
MRWPAIVRKKERRAQSRGAVGVRLGSGTRACGQWLEGGLAIRSRKGADGERRIKRLQRLAGGALDLSRNNEHDQPEMITPQQMGEVEILGR